MIPIRQECGKYANQSQTELKELLFTFFLSLAVSEERIKALIPVYEESLSKYDFGLMSENLLNMVETWVSENNRIPSVANVIEQYRILKSRKQGVKRRNPEPQAVKAAAKFWGEYKRCRESGINDAAVIAKYLQKLFGSDMTRSVCKHNFCDGKGWVVAVRRDDPYRSETIFNCRCAENVTIKEWDGDKDYKIIKGLSDVMASQQVK